jgi:hypothetical protein
MYFMDKITNNKAVEATLHDWRDTNDFTNINFLRNIFHSLATSSSNCVSIMTHSKEVNLTTAAKIGSSSSVFKVSNNTKRDHVKNIFNSSSSFSILSDAFSNDAIGTAAIEQRKDDNNGNAHNIPNEYDESQTLCDAVCTGHKQITSLTYAIENSNSKIAELLALRSLPVCQYPPPNMTPFPGLISSSNSKTSGKTIVL